MSQPEDARRRDIRMKGFAERSLVDDALNWVDRHAVPGMTESIALENCFDRVLAADVVAKIDVPGFDRSAMDGYALKADETSGASTFNPLTFSIVGQSMPGSPFASEVRSGEVVRIMTGAPIPKGVDAVVPAEYATEENNRVEITAPVPPAKHIGRRGEDVTTGDLLFATGRQLRPQDVGLLASIGETEIPVVSRPRIRLIVTGNELARPGQPKSPWQIYESNSLIVAGLIDRDGGRLLPIEFIADEQERLKDAMLKEGADVILISGGSSVGKEDFAPGILADEGELAIHGVAMRPSSPAGMGQLGTSLVFLLPGNPVSCLCAYDFFAGRAIRRMGGHSGDWPYVQQALPLGDKKIVSAVGRVDYCRVKVEAGRVTPLALSGASILSSTSRADGFVVVPAESEGFGSGSVVTVNFYQSPPR